MAFVGLNEALLIGAVILALIIGPKKLPELARSIGQSKQAYKESMQKADEAVEDVKPDDEDSTEK
jgi:TatA/E family protein of Tat protein translocase